MVSFNHRARGGTVPDKTLFCQDCKNPFVFTEAEQDRFSKNVDGRTGQPWSEPKRCKACRDERKRVMKPKQDQQTG
jgi:Probable zinc-ribbon domain